jgi:hypothetical protein
MRDRPSEKTGRLCSHRAVCRHRTDVDLAALSAAARPWPTAGGEPAMSQFRQAVEQYLRVRRALGHEFLPGAGCRADGYPDGCGLPGPAAADPAPYLRQLAMSVVT